MHRVIHIDLEIGKSPVAGQFILGNMLLPGRREGFQIPVAGYGEEILVVDRRAQNSLQLLMQQGDFLLQFACLAGDEKPFLHRPVQVLDIGQQGPGPVAHALDNGIVTGLRLKHVNPGFENLPVRSHRIPDIFQLLQSAGRRKTRSRRHQRAALLGYRESAGDLGKTAIDYAPLRVGDGIERKPAIDARKYEKQQRCADPHVHADRNLVALLQHSRKTGIEAAIAVVFLGIHWRGPGVSTGTYSPSGLTTVRYTASDPW